MRGVAVAELSCPAQHQIGDDVDLRDRGQILDMVPAIDRILQMRSKLVSGTPQVGGTVHNSQSSIPELDDFSLLW